jgi:hypothetical protein
VRLYGGERIVCGTDGTEFGCDWTRKAAPGDKALRLAELSRKDFVLWSYDILNGKFASRTELPICQIGGTVMATVIAQPISNTMVEERILLQLRGAVVPRRNHAMSSLPAWAKFSIITAGVLLLPVFAFLLTLVVEILLGLLIEARLPAPVSLVIAGAIGWFLFRKLWPCPPGNPPVKDKGGPRNPAAGEPAVLDTSRPPGTRFFQAYILPGD